MRKAERKRQAEQAAADKAKARAHADKLLAEMITKLQAPPPPTPQHLIVPATGNWATVGGSLHVSPTPKPPLLREPEDLPILAHRAAYLRVSQVGGTGIGLFSLNHGVRLDIDSDAQCLCRPNIVTYTVQQAMLRYGMTPASSPDEPAPVVTHEVPEDRGQCGFYAVPADVDAQHGVYTVDLLVELSGKVVIHELGYRAQHQRIIEVRMPWPCVICREPPTHVRFDVVSGTSFPVCDDDADKPATMPNELDFGNTELPVGGLAVSYRRLSEVLGVPVTNGPN